MDTITTALAVLAGILLRFGLPILVMVIAVYFLRRLDNRWQEEAQENGRSQSCRHRRLPAGKYTTARTRSNAPPISIREPLAGSSSGPMKGLLKESCLDCSVFRNAPVPVRA